MGKPNAKLNQLTKGFVRPFRCRRSHPDEENKKCSPSLSHRKDMKTRSVLLLFVCSSFVIAQEREQRTPTPTAESFFKRYDKNADGRISRKEAGDAKFFDRLDANGNGFITQREANVFAQRNRAQIRPQQVEASGPVFPPNPDAEAVRRKFSSRSNRSPRRRPTAQYRADLGRRSRLRRHGDLWFQGHSDTAYRYVGSPPASS